MPLGEKSCDFQNAEWIVSISLIITYKRFFVLLLLLISFVLLLLINFFFTDILYKYFIFLCVCLLYVFRLCSFDVCSFRSTKYLQKHQVIVTSFGCCRMDGRGDRQSPNCWKS